MTALRLLLVLFMTMPSLYRTTLSATVGTPCSVWSPHGPSSCETIPLSGGVVEHSSPTLADIDGDGTPDVVIGTTRQDGSNNNSRDRAAVLNVLKGNGDVIWQQEVNAPINSAPAVGDINHDGKPEIVISTGGDVGDRQRNGGLIAFDHAGHQMWFYAFQDHDPKDGFSDGAFSSPTLCDLNGDGYMEIIVGGWDQRIHVVDHNGYPVWKNLDARFSGPGYYNADTVWSTAACADLNRDGKKEIIIGADITGGGKMPDGTAPKDGGFLYVFDKDGNVLARRYVTETVYSSPAVADLNGDGSPEIVVGTGWYWWDRHGRKDTSYVYVFDTSKVFSNLAYGDPAKLPDFPGWPQATKYPGFSSPAVGDLDDDGKLEVVIGSGDPYVKNDRIDGAGMVYAWHANGQSVAGWPISPKSADGIDSQIKSSPVLADVNGDGLIDVLFAMIWDVQVYNRDGTLQEILPGGWTVVSSPAVGDTNGNGRADIWIGSSYHPDPSHGWIWHYESSQTGAILAPWPTFHGDAANSGVLGWPPPQRAEAQSASLLYRALDTNVSVRQPTVVTLSLRIYNSGDTALEWQANYSNETRVQLVPKNGTVAPHTFTTVNAKIQVGDLTLGSHDLGTVNLVVKDNQGPLSDSPIHVPVVVYKGPVNYVYLPGVQSVK